MIPGPETERSIRSTEQANLDKAALKEKDFLVTQIPTRSRKILKRMKEDAETDFPLVKSTPDATSILETLKEFRDSLPEEAKGKPKDPVQDVVLHYVREQLIWPELRDKVSGTDVKQWLTLQKENHLLKPADATAVIRAWSDIRKTLQKFEVPPETIKAMAVEDLSESAVRNLFTGIHWKKLRNIGRIHPKIIGISLSFNQEKTKELETAQKRFQEEFLEPANEEFYHGIISVVVRGEKKEKKKPTDLD
jgi:hypothetical protein